MVVEGGIVVTESSRDKLWRLLCFLGWSEAIVGAILAVVVYRPAASLSDVLPRSHNSLLHVFYAELIVGLTSAVVAVQGILVSQASLHNPLMISTTRAYKTWLVLGVTLDISLTVALVVIPPAIDAEKNEILEIMKGGVSSYLSNLEWKTKLDKLHQQYQCCGVSSISDWYTSRWIPIRSIRPEVADLQDVLSEDGTLGARVVPASCCNPFVRLPCFHDTLQQNSSPADTRTVLHPETVFTRGCGSLVVDPAASTVGPFKVLAITILLLQGTNLIQLEMSPKNDSCATSPTCGSAEGRRRGKELAIFRRKGATTTSEASFEKSKVRKLGEAIKCVSRSMLCGLQRRSSRSSVGSSTRKRKPCCGVKRNQNSVVSTNSVHVYPVSVDTDVDSRSSWSSLQQPLTRTAIIRPARIVKSKIRSYNASAEVKPKFLEHMRKPETNQNENELELLNLFEH